MRYAKRHRRDRLDAAGPESQAPVVSKKTKPAPDEIGRRPVAWRDLVILCRKCGGKRKGGFGEDGSDDLRAALRKGLRAAGYGRSVRVIETGCLGICPKRAVVAFRGADPSQLLIVPRGRGVSDILGHLGFILPE